MTVNELIARLNELAQQGCGEMEIISNHEYIEEANYSEELEVVLID